MGLEGDPAEAATTLGEPLYVGDGYATLDPNFEGAVKALFGDEWTRLYEKAVSSVGESKPLRARYAAQRLADVNFAGIAGDRIDALVRAIRGEGPVDGSHADAPDDPSGGNPGKSYDPEPWGADEPPF